MSSSPKLAEAVCNGEVYKTIDLPTASFQEPELGAQYQVKVKFPWLSSPAPSRG